MDPRDIPRVCLSRQQSVEIQRFMKRFANPFSRRFENGLLNLAAEAPVSAAEILGDQYSILMSVALDDGMAVIIEDEGDLTKWWKPGARSAVEEEVHSRFVRYNKRKALFFVSALGLAPWTWDFQNPENLVSKVLPPEVYAHDDAVHPNVKCLDTDRQQLGIEFPYDYDEHLFGPYRPRVLCFLAAYVDWGLEETGPWLMCPSEAVSLIDEETLEVLTGPHFNIRPTPYWQNFNDPRYKDCGHFCAQRQPVLSDRGGSIFHSTFRVGNFDGVQPSYDLYAKAVVQLDSLMFAQRKGVPRVTLGTGDMLIINNYHMVHEWNGQATTKIGKMTGGRGRPHPLRRGQRTIYRTGGYLTSSSPMKDKILAHSEAATMGGALSVAA